MAIRDLADQGLCHRVGDDAMKGNYQEMGEDLAPDGWGRYLAGDRELLISLEWDRGTDPLPSLHRKIRAYAEDYSRRGAPSGNHVLLVAPIAARERSIRSITAHLFDRTPGFYLWTTRTKLLREQGPLSATWQELSAGEPPRRRLAELPSRARSDLRVEDSIAKPGWWERRPGGGDGA